MSYPSRRGAGAPGANGADGKQVELQQSSENIQWRYAGESSWRNLMPLSMITGRDGSDGRSVDLRESGGWVQWHHQGDQQWQNLISMDDMRGADGRDGIDGKDGNDGQPGASVDLRSSAGFVQWKRTDSATWNNIIAVSDLRGADGTNGANGVDGSAVQLQKTATQIQWRLSGDASWQNLVSLSELTGSPGRDGANGTNGANYTPQPMASKSVTIATPYQHSDTTKPFKIMLNARSTQTVTVAGVVNDKVELRVGPTQASVAPNGSGGFSVGIWESGITGIALMIGAAVQDGGQITADVPAGWYFQINRLSGNNATIVSCFTQSMS